jgi:hypothetical protein
MHGNHEDITKVGYNLTEPSQMIEPGREEGEQQSKKEQYAGVNRHIAHATQLHERGGFTFLLYQLLLPLLPTTHSFIL